MKRMQKAYTLILSMLMMFAAAFSVTAYAEEDSYRYFTPEAAFTIDAATGLITGYSGSDTTVVVPSVIQGVNVTGISTAFTDNTTIQTLIIPDTMQIWGDGAFSGCTALSTIGTYTLIPGDFLAEEASRSAYFTKSLRIEEAAADSTNYYYITMKTGCVKLPTALTSIGALAFRKTISVGGFVIPTANTAFKTQDTCTIKDLQGTEITYGYGPLLLSGDGSVMYRWASAYHYAGEYVLPEGILSILDCSAEHANDVQGFKIPSTATTIGNYAFSQGNNINTITFPENAQVTTIGAWAFAYNSNLHSALPKSVTTLGEYCFSNCVNMELSIENSSLTAIPDYCFYECNNYHFTTFPPTLSSIGKYAFYNCDNINNVYFTDGITYIGEGAFKDCQNLHEIKVPEGLTTLEADTFAGCQNLEVIELPDSLKRIETGAFQDCQNIKELVIPPNVDYIAPDSFDGVHPEEIDTSENDYAQKNLPGVLPKKNEIIIVNGLKYKVTKSSKKAGTVQITGAVSKKITTLTIPSAITYRTFGFKVTSIKAKAFNGYKKLKTVTIGNNVASIGSAAFKNNKKLKKVTIGKKVKTIGKEAFSGDKALKTIKIKSKVLKSVKKNAFKGINKKAIITLPKSKYTRLKKLLKGKGQPGSVRYKKG